MEILTSEDLMSLERYATVRPQFRTQVLAHKKNRQVAIGPNAKFLFEDRLTVQYQIQEMLRIERIFEPKAIQDELNAYNPLVPNGQQWKATFMLEFSDVAARHVALAAMCGIEDLVWVQVAGNEKIFGIADEDLERSNAEKTSAVHFMRFEFTPAMIAAAHKNAEITMGIDHPAYMQHTKLAEQTHAALVQDLILPV